MLSAASDLASQAQERLSQATGMAKQGQSQTQEEQQRQKQGGEGHPSTKAKREQTVQPAGAQQSSSHEAQGQTQEQGQQKKQSDLRNVVIGVNGSDHSETAVRWALKNVIRHDSDMIHLVYIASKDAYNEELRATSEVSKTREEEHKGTRSILQQAGGIVQECAKKCGEEAKMTLRLLDGTDARDALMAYCQDYKADLLIVGCRGRGAMARMFLGSVSDHMLHNAPCPVLIVREANVEIPGDQEQRENQKQHEEEKEQLRRQQRELEEEKMRKTEQQSQQPAHTMQQASQQQREPAHQGR